MPRIRKPKSLDQLRHEYQPDQWQPLLKKYGAIDRKGRYLHWDQFQWRVEKDDNPEAAWFATKFSREVIREDFADLLATQDQHFGFCVPNSLFQKLHRLDQMTGGGRQLTANNLVSVGHKEQYLVKTLMYEEAITSSQLEGASTTRKIAKEMLTKRLSPKDKSEQMIFNNFRLMQRAIECRDQDLSIDMLLNFHEIATEQAIENQGVPGEFRQNNSIFISDIYGEPIFEPPDYKSVKSRLESLCVFANKTDDDDSFTHPIIKAIILHFMLAYLHPFSDGNGRTARALFYWSMLKAGYWLFEYVSISRLIQEKRGDYDRAFLYTETDDFDLTYFIYNQVETITKSVQLLFDYIEKKKKDFYDFMAWIENSPIAKKLKDKEKKILQVAFREPGKEFTVRQVSFEFGVTENTARQYLNRLVQQEFLLLGKEKKRKANIYVSPANLKSRLQLS